MMRCLARRSEADRVTVIQQPAAARCSSARPWRFDDSDITGVGGTQAFDPLEIPEVRFGIGPTEVLLRPATNTLQRIGTIGGECCVGNVGNDLLKRTGFTIDFSAMTLRLHNPKD